MYQVDAFSTRLFSGNPAAVVLPERVLPDEMMQAIAAENNLSETAFVEKEGKGYRIRWFTPTLEVNLCGHATLAAAHVVFNHLGHSESTVSFSSRSGLLYVRREEKRLYLNFPSDAFDVVVPPSLLENAMGVTPEEVYRGRDDYLVILDAERSVAELNPEMTKLSQVPARGVIVSAPGDDSDFVSRFFAPQCGVPEDPVTGSAHTTLIPYWSRRLGKEDMRARQISPRGGDLVCKNLGDRVEIGGCAITYLVGEILFP
jgi:PhzF family phenazine biosynthesis protein